MRMYFLRYLCTQTAINLNIIYSIYGINKM